MKKEEKTLQEREAIIAQYLMGGITYRKLEEQHGVDFRKIHFWVTKFQGIEMKKVKPTSKSKQELPQEELPRDVKKLQEELRKAQLHNKLLNAIIDIAEEKLKIDIRKKSGTKP